MWERGTVTYNLPFQINFETKKNHIAVKPGNFFTTNQWSVLIPNHAIMIPDLNN